MMCPRTRLAPTEAYKEQEVDTKDKRPDSPDDAVFVYEVSDEALEHAAGSTGPPTHQSGQCCGSNTGDRCG